MLYSVCCGVPSYMAPHIDICPYCREHTDWEDENAEEIDNQIVSDSRTANEMLKACNTCEHMRGSIELRVDYCAHFKFQHMHPIIHNPDTVLADCPLK